MPEFLRRLLSGGREEVSFGGLPVYHNWMHGEEYDIIGSCQDKKEWIRNNISDDEQYEAISFMLADWELYEKGWLIASYDNTRLYQYLSQICYNRPNELNYVKGYIKN